MRFIIIMGALLISLAACAPLKKNYTPQQVIVTPTAEPIDQGVLDFIQALKTTDGHLVWSSMSPSLQSTLESSGGSEADYVAAAEAAKKQGITVNSVQVVRTYTTSDGVRYYLVVGDYTFSGNTTHTINVYLVATNKNGKVDFLTN